MRDFGGKLVIVLTSVVLGLVAFGIFDFLVISSLIVDTESGDKFGYVHYEDGWYILAPNVRVVSAWGKTVYPWRTDANGFRIDPASTSPSRQADVIFLGDSFTFGTGLPWEDTFVGLYERSSGRTIANAGVSSYSPTAYLWQYKRAISAGALKSPHAVVVAIDISDVQDEAAVWEDGQDHPRRRNYPASSAVVSSPLKTFIASRLLGTRSIYRMFTQSTVAADPFDQIRSAFTWKEASEIEPARPEIPGPYEGLGYKPLGVEGALARIREKLLEISTVAREHNGSLWILIYPWPAQLRHPSKVIDWEEFNINLCREIGCRNVINTFPRFKSFTNDDDWYKKLFVNGDVHFNKFGNQIIADELVANLK
jgi:hypothetical protein